MPGGGLFCPQKSRLLMSRADGRTCVYRRREERYAPKCAKQVDRFDGGTVMMWEGIHHGGRTCLVHVVGALMGFRHRDEILHNHVIPHIYVNGGMFQHYNSRPNVTRVSHTYAYIHVSG